MPKLTAGTPGAVVRVIAPAIARYQLLRAACWCVMLHATVACTSLTSADDPAGSGKPATPPPVSATAYRMMAIIGDGQWALEGSAVELPPTVVVLDAQQQPVEGERVMFRVLEGNGTLTDTSVTTDAAGWAKIGRWTLGSAGSPQRVVARINGNEVVFAAVSVRSADTTSLRGLRYVRNQSVFASGESGTEPRRLLQLARFRKAVAIAPNDSFVALLDELSGAVCIVELANGAQRCAKPVDHGNLSYFNWSPDSQELLFSANQQILCNAPGGVCFGQFFRVFALNIASMTVTPSALSNSTHPIATAWAPDGRTLAYALNDIVYQANADGTQRRSLATLRWGADVHSLRWSPDGRALVMGLGFRNRCMWLCDSGIGVLDLQNGQARLLAEVRTDNDVYTTAPLWSPDGTRVIFSLERIERCTTTAACGINMYSVAAAGGPPMQLLTDASALSWR